MKLVVWFGASVANRSASEKHATSRKMNITIMSRLVVVSLNLESSRAVFTCKMGSEKRYPK